MVANLLISYLVGNSCHNNRSYTRYLNLAPPESKTNVCKTELIRHSKWKANCCSVSVFDTYDPGVGHQTLSHRWSTLQFVDRQCHTQSAHINVTRTGHLPLKYERICYSDFKHWNVSSINSWIFLIKADTIVLLCGDSLEQSPSEVNSFWAGQEIPRFIYSTVSSPCEQNPMIRLCRE
jgi:hypothetical protein